MKNLFKILTTSTITEEHFDQYLVIAKTKEETKLKLGKWLNDIYLIDELT